MKYLVDSNIWIAYLRSKNALVRSRIGACLPTDIVLCSPVKAELLYGVQRSAQVQQNMVALRELFALFVSLPFDDRAAEIAADIRIYLAQLGTPIGPYDVLIAAIALAHDLTLVTANTREFSRVPDLRLENWEIA